LNLTSYLLSAHTLTAGIFFVAASLVGCDSRTSVTDLSPPAGKINDTGLLTCSNFALEQSNCPQAELPGQDAEYGRDLLHAEGKLTKIGYGAAGFDFTKLSSTGVPLAQQTVAWANDGEETTGSRWSCVQDNVTGLIWEIKESDENHPRYGGHTYSWFENSVALNGGQSGFENGGACLEMSCDTQGYRTWLNQQSLCGFDDWRIPTASELVSLAYANSGSRAIDSNIFPNTPKPRFFTRDTFAKDPTLAWYVYFTDASVSFTNKFDASNLRLVRGGQ
jgi:hypothetical protein